jgi:hypothetical protein
VMRHNLAVVLGPDLVPRPQTGSLAATRNPSRLDSAALAAPGRRRHEPERPGHRGR